MNNKKIIMMQTIFLIAVIIVVYFLYPRAEIDVNGEWVRFDSINANVIMISENPDFSNPRFLDLSERDNISFNLNPGTYYWKSDNGIIQGLKNQFIIDSEIGLGVNQTEDDLDLVNIGNVKINVTKEGGVMVGHIVLEPDESEKIDDDGKYIGRQAE